MAYPKTESLCRSLRCKVMRVTSEDDERSPARQSGRWSHRGKRAWGWALVKMGRTISPVFWCKANLESHCNRRWHRYLKTRPKGHGEGGV